MQSSSVTSFWAPIFYHGGEQSKDTYAPRIDFEDNEDLWDEMESRYTHDHRKAIEEQTYSIEQDIDANMHRLCIGETLERFHHELTSPRLMQAYMTLAMMEKLSAGVRSGTFSATVFNAYIWQILAPEPCGYNQLRALIFISPEADLFQVAFGDKHATAALAEPIYQGLDNIPAWHLFVREHLPAWTNKYHIPTADLFSGLESLGLPDDKIGVASWLMMTDFTENAPCLSTPTGPIVAQSKDRAVEQSPGPPRVMKVPKACPTACLRDIPGDSPFPDQRTCRQSNHRRNVDLRSEGLPKIRTSLGLTPSDIVEMGFQLRKQMALWQEARRKRKLIQQDDAEPRKRREMAQQEAAHQLEPLREEAESIAQLRSPGDWSQPNVCPRSIHEKPEEIDWKRSFRVPRAFNFSSSEDSVDEWYECSSLPEYRD